MRRFSFRRFFLWALLAVGSLMLCAVLLMGTVLAIILVAEAGDSGALPADCAVVFGAAVYGYNKPGPAIVRRVNTAATLYRSGKLKRLIVTGGEGRGPGTSISEAQVMRTEAIAQGVRSSDIVLEEESHSTFENLRFTKSLIAKCASVVAISDGYHLARIKLLAWQAGWPSLKTVATEIRPQARSEWRSIAREDAAYIYSLLYLQYVLPSWLGISAGQ